MALGDAAYKVKVPLEAGLSLLESKEVTFSYVEELDIDKHGRLWLFAEDEELLAVFDKYQWISVERVN